MLFPPFPPMLVDLTLRGRRVLVVGRGELAEARRRTVASEGAHVLLIPPPAAGAPARAGRRGRSPLRPTDIVAARVRKERPTLVFSTGGTEEENREIARTARSVGALVHVYDAPALSDFTLPSTGVAGPIRLAVSTSGQSPAMAALLRRRLERGLRPQDAALVELQGNLRATIRRAIPSSFEDRRATIYRIARDRTVARHLRAGDRAAALRVALRIIAVQAARSARPRPRP